MGKGRKSTSDSQKRMKGTDQPCRLSGSDKVLPAITKLPPPRGLTPKGRKIYRQVGNTLMNLGILNEINFIHFFQYVKETELYLITMDEMPTPGHMVHELETKSGDVYTQVRAMRKIAQDALSNSRSLAAEFGLTPQAQAKIIGMVSKKTKDPLEQFLDNEPG